MGAVAYRKVIVARVHYICLVIFVIIACYIGKVNRYGERLRRSFAVESLRLGKAAELNGRFFYAALGIRRLRIDLNDVFAGDIGGVVGYGYGNLGSLIIPVYLNAVKRLGEIGIRHTPAERELNFLFILPGAARGSINARRRRSVAFAEHGVFVPRFVVTVTYIYALVIHNVFARVGVGYRSRICKLKVAEILHCGGRERIVCVRIGKVSRRVYLADEYIGYGVHSHLAGAAYIQNCVDVVFFHPTEFHRVEGVENDDALVEVALFHLFEHRPFVFVKGKIAVALG